MPSVFQNAAYIPYCNSGWTTLSVKTT